ncbi:MAG TPA: hypothetical protein VGP92_14000 [Acidimicrobiia bacterium]|jgi:hypothetical protein|nr:hypothetical protein [Acidimicrobiia bacterium]
MPDHLGTFEPTQLDELLSAELDGELAAAARDLGSSVEDVAARLRATPGADARRAALVAARALLEQAPPIDELTATRLRTAALQAATEVRADPVDDRRRRRNRVLTVSGAIAAAILAVVAIATALSGNHSGTVSATAKPAAVQPATAPEKSADHRALGAAGSTTTPATTPALGAFADVKALAVAAANNGAIARPDPNAPQLSFKDSTTNDKYRLTAPAPTTSSGDQVAQNRAAAGAPVSKSKSLTTPLHGNGVCASPLQIPGGTAPALRATATLAGKPVVVLVYLGTNERIVVVEDVDCKLLNLQLLR